MGVENEKNNHRIAGFSLSGQRLFMGLRSASSGTGATEPIQPEYNRERTKLMKILFSILMLLIGATYTSLAHAHPGGTDSAGCHHCRTNCEDWGLGYGEYHCH